MDMLFRRVLSQTITLRHGLVTALRANVSQIFGIRISWLSTCTKCSLSVFSILRRSLLSGGSYAKPVATFDANVMGSIYLMEAVRQMKQPCAVIMVTSDKCYLNVNQVWGYRECDPLGGHDPYSANKAAAEIAIASYRNSFFPPKSAAEHRVHLASVRAGNVIGGVTGLRIGLFLMRFVRLLRGGDLRYEIRKPSGPDSMCLSRFRDICFLRQEDACQRKYAGGCVEHRASADRSGNGS